MPTIPAMQAEPVERSWAAWRNVAGSAVVLALAMATMWGTTFGMFIAAFEREFGWSRTQITFGLALMTLQAPLVGPLAGWLIDRHRLLPLIVGALVLQALLFAWLALMGGSIAWYYLLCCVLPWASLGASAMSLGKLVSAWFTARRGAALGIMFAAASLGPVLHPLWANAVMTQSGWRTVYWAMAVLTLFLAIPCALGLLRERQTANTSQASSTAGAGTASPTTGTNIAQVLRDAAFWWICAYMALFALSLASVQTHLFPLLTERGATPGQAAIAQSLLGGGLLLGNLVGGMLIDRFNAARVASALLVLPISAVLILWLAPASSLGLSLAAAALLGMATGGEATFLTYLVGRYFGQQYFARIYALLVVAMSLGGGLGPVASAWLHERGGNYDWMLIACLAALICAMVPPLRLGPYRH